VSERIVETDTNVLEVTFFEDRAEVVRAFATSVGAGRTRLVAKGLSLLVDDRSLVCREVSGATVVYVRVRRRVHEETSATAEELSTLEAETERARARLHRAERALASAMADAQRLRALLRIWVQTVASVPSGGADELSCAYAEMDRATIARLDEFAQLRRERDDASSELVRAELRLEEGRLRRPRYEATAEIDIVAEADGEVQMRLAYRTPCALWRPEHRARLVKTESSTGTGTGTGTGTIEITTVATLWQCTGETWKDVRCRFSTARPAESATTPLLADDVLFTRKKTDTERKQVVVEAREQTIALAGAARGTRDVDDMPGVDDGGETQWLTGKTTTTIPSDGLPVRVEIDERVVPCSIARVAHPEVGPVTHVRATATLTGTTPLLAGPVTIARETEVVGRGRVSFVAPGEPFEIGFGTDDALRVRRRVIEKRKTTQLTGTQHVSREVRLYVSNLSDAPQSLSIVERVPVSEVEDVTIEVERQPHMRHDTKDGFATFELDLPAGATRDMVLRYRIEAKSNVVLPELVT
jgi:uncharacterized protein (TIGR02231 family)